MILEGSSIFMMDIFQSWGMINFNGIDWYLRTSHLGFSVAKFF
jgi:hypothetical protein